MNKLIKIICLFVLALSVSATTSTAETNDDFTHWPDQLSPQEIGHKAAAAFIKSPHMLYPTNNAIHYAEVLTWYGVINFAKNTQNKDSPTAPVFWEEVTVGWLPG